MNMKKITWLIALVLCVSLLAGCAESGTTASTEPTATPVAATEAPTATPEPTATAEATATPEPTATAAPVTAQQNGLYDILCDLMQNYYPGTAGSSLTGARIAAQMVEFCIANGTDAVRAGAMAYETSDTDTLTAYLSRMYETAMGLYGDYGKGQLSDGGFTPTCYPYTAKQVRDTFTAVYDGLSLGYAIPTIVRIYTPNVNADGFLVTSMVIESGKIDAESLTSLMQDFVWENGETINSVSVDAEGHITADLNEAFATTVRSLGTSGEYCYVGGLVNTLLDALDGEDVTLTVQGSVLETGHQIYNYAITRYEEKAQ